MMGKLGRYLESFCIRHLGRLALVAGASALLTSAHAQMGLEAGTSFNSSLHQPSDPESSQSQDFSLLSSYKFTSAGKISVTVAGNKALDGERKYLWEDSSVSFSRSLHQASWGSISSTLVGFYPTSKESKDNQQMRGAVRFFPTFATSFKRLDLAFSPRYRHNFHRYQTDMSGKSNTQYNISGRFIASFNFTDRFYTSLDSIYGRSYTYQGNTKDSYSFDHSLGFMPTPSTDISIGHNISGAPLNAAGDESKVSLFDQQKSQVYLALKYVF